MDEVDRRAIIRVKQQVAHLYKPNPWIYWTDLWVSSSVGWGAFVLALVLSRGEPVLGSTWTAGALVGACLFVATFALYRALAFTHELEHLPDGALPGFRGVWHVLIGMPFLLPHFVYHGVHRIHHSTKYYGTPQDPEYLPYVAKGSFRVPISFLVLGLIFPAVLAVRYLVLSPLALVSPRMRTWVDVKASAFVMKLDYARQLPSGRAMVVWRIEEYSTVAFVWAVVGLVYTGVLPALAVAYWFVVLAGIMVVNCIRGLAATHGYASSGEQLSFEDHIADCVNLERFSILNLLVGPLGLTFHATHHVFPGLPYYALPRAHALLTREMQGEGTPLAFYGAAQWGTIVQAIVKLIRSTRVGRVAPATRPVTNEPSIAPAYPDF